MDGCFGWELKGVLAALLFDCALSSPPWRGMRRRCGRRWRRWGDWRWRWRTGSANSSSCPRRCARCRGHAFPAGGPISLCDCFGLPLFTYPHPDRPECCLPAWLPISLPCVFFSVYVCNGMAVVYAIGRTVPLGAFTAHRLPPPQATDKLQASEDRNDLAFVHMLSASVECTFPSPTILWRCLKVLYSTQRHEVFPLDGGWFFANTQWVCTRVFFFSVPRDFWQICPHFSEGCL